MGKEYIEPRKSRLDKGRRGRKRRVIRNRSARGGVRELKQGSDPHIRATVWDRGEAFEAIVYLAHVFHLARAYIFDVASF